MHAAESASLGFFLYRNFRVILNSGWVPVDGESKQSIIMTQLEALLEPREYGERKADVGSRAAVDPPQFPDERRVGVKVCSTSLLGEHLVVR